MCPSASNTPRDSGLFAGYPSDPVFYDEMFDDSGEPHPHCRALWKALDTMPPAELMALQELVEHSFLHEGITFAVYGEGEAHERIIPIDCLPRILDALEWSHLERGLEQRLRALNLFLADVYGPGRVFTDGVIPVDLVRGCPQYRIEMRGSNHRTASTLRSAALISCVPTTVSWCSRTISGCPRGSPTCSPTGGR